MSLWNSLSISVTGMQSQSSKLGVISQNISNVNTIGYKQQVGTFADIISRDGAAGYNPNGVRPMSTSSNRATGETQRTESPLDLSILGDGFFAVTRTAAETASSNNLLYTRAGSFHQDPNGNFVNRNGFYLQGWRLDADGNVPASLNTATVDGSSGIGALSLVNIQELNNTPTPTTAVTVRATLPATQAPLANNQLTYAGNLRALQPVQPTTSATMTSNLLSTATAYAGAPAYDPASATSNMASGIISSTFGTSMNVYDSAGGERQVNVSYLKTGTNSWAVEIHAADHASITPATGLPSGMIASGNITFNANGTVASVDTSLSDPVDIAWNTPSTTSNITFNFGAPNSSTVSRQSTDAYSSLLTARPDYDPNDVLRNMSSAVVAPDFSQVSTLTDSAGNTRTVTANFLKTATDEWDIELTATPITDLVSATGAAPGLIASGRATFNSDGTLATISPGLTNAIAVNWLNNTQADTLQYDWGTIGSSTGLTQLSNSVQPNFTGSSTVTANYSPLTSNMASGDVSPHFTSPVTIVDGTGATHDLQIGFLKTGVNTWAVEIFARNATDVETTDGLVASGTVIFNGDGTLNSVSPSLLGDLDIDWSGTAPNNSTAFNWGTAGAIFGTPNTVLIGRADGLSQINAPYSQTISQNGIESAEFKDIVITDEGVVQARYQNGAVFSFYKIPLANFVEPNRLESISGDVFRETNVSGDVSFLQPGVGSNGKFAVSALEQSNVDTSEELTNLIIAQRSYQFNSKIASTTDDMLSKLYQMGAS